MKKLILFSFTLLFFASCEQEIIPENLESNSSSEEILHQISYNVDGENIILQVSVLDGEALILQNENALRLQEIFNTEGIITYVDSNEKAPLLFTSEKKYNEFRSDEKRFAARSKELGRKTNYSDENTARAGQGYVYLGRPASTLEVSIPVVTQYSNRHLGFNTCTTGGINFQDNLSFISVSAGTEARFYVHDDYRGDQLMLDASLSDDDIGWHDLHDIKRRNFTVIQDNDEWINELCGAFCNSYNDVFTSLSAGANSYSSLYSNRNFTNVCGSSGGGSGGGGDLPPKPKDQYQ